ncbi:MAG TPA: hypothetical protein VG273_15730, partial [Bryobacteraceae bacterium]|nr:hypothetical protein [Bryobacteraceae bacterium]
HSHRYAIRAQMAAVPGKVMRLPFAQAERQSRPLEETCFPGNTLPGPDGNGICFVRLEYGLGLFFIFCPTDEAGGPGHVFSS